MISKSEEEEEERARTVREGLGFVLGVGLEGGFAGELDPKGLVEYLFGDEDDRDVERLDFDLLGRATTGGFDVETEARMDARRSVASVFEPFFLFNAACSSAGARRVGSFLGACGSTTLSEWLGEDLVKGVEMMVV